MKKILIGFIAGIILTAAIGSAYVHQNMIDMNRVADVQSTETGALIVLEDGNGYYWER